MKTQTKIILISSASAAFLLLVVVLAVTSQSRCYGRAVKVYRAGQFRQALSIIASLPPAYQARSKASYLRSDALLQLALQEFGNSKYDEALSYLNGIPSSFSKFDEVEVLIETASCETARLENEKAQFEAEQRNRKETERRRQQRAKEKAGVSNITFHEFDKVFNENSKYTELQKQEAWKSFKGKKVQWPGVVGSVAGTSTGVNLVVRMSDDIWGTGLLLIHLKSTEKDKAMKLKENDAVTFRATLRERTFSDRIVLDYGEIVE